MIEFAVLVALFDEANEAHVILTRRAAHLRRNQGEIALPGGRIEPGETPVMAALREANEEVDLSPDELEVMGELSPLSTVSRTTEILPVLARLAQRAELIANPDEVAEIFDVSLAALAADGAFTEELWDLPDGTTRPIYFFDVEGRIIWGATARVLHELLTLVLDVDAKVPGP